MAECCNHFEFTDDGDSFESWQGLRGPYYIPHLSADGVLSWTNTGNLPNPQPVDISGPPGSSVELRGPVPSVEDLPATASSSELWLVGAASPYDGWFYNGVQWEDAGEIAVGPTGPQGPAGADGTDGSNGVTFTPTVSSAGVISWTNDGSLPNPDPVDIKGPQGETGAAGSDGSNGATFTPAVSSAGVISWTNDGGLPNPQSVNIKGPQGETGETGPAGQDGTDGSNGVTFTPTVSSAGVISWTNDGGFPNPQSVNIKGPQGETGATGATGPAGPGVPIGGTAGQVLTKTGAADYATAWRTEDLGISGASVDDFVKIAAVDANGKPTAFSKGTPGGGDVTADMLGIVIDGNSTPVGASAGQYVIVKNSAISGITDGLYRAAQAIPANTAIDSTYLTTASNGGLNDLLSRTQWVRIWTNASPNSSFAEQDVAISGMAEFGEYRIQLSDYMTSTAPSFQLTIGGYGRGEQWSFNAAKFHYRVVYTTANGVTFRDSRTFSAYGSTTSEVNNSYLIPWYIEGKKN